MISFLTAKFILRKNLRVQANDKFRSVFMDELYLLEKANVDTYKILNDSAFEKHERAKLEFEIFLYKGEIKSFIGSWSKYRKYAQLTWGQQISPGSIDVREKECRKAKLHIKCLLEYTTSA